MYVRSQDGNVYLVKSIMLQLTNFRVGETTSKARWIRFSFVDELPQACPLLVWDLVYIIVNYIKGNGFQARQIVMQYPQLLNTVQARQAKSSRLDHGVK